MIAFAKLFAVGAKVFSMIPSTAWIVAGVAAAFLYYGNYVKKKTEATVRLEYRLAQEAETKRQQQVFKTAREANRKRAEAYRKWQEHNDKEWEAALEQLKKDMQDEAKANQAANAQPGSKTKCPVCIDSIPGGFLDRLPRPRSNNRNP